MWTDAEIDYRLTSSRRPSSHIWLLSLLLLACSHQNDSIERRRASDSMPAPPSVDGTRSATRKGSIEDTAYGRELAKWLRDSTVLDSMMRLVRTDSLYRLYRRALEPPGVTLALVQEVWCEELQLSKYGVIPSRRAVKRMLDTVYRDRGIRDGFAYFAARAPSSGLVEGSKCRSHGGVFLDTVGQTPLGVELPPRPRPPS